MTKVHIFLIRAVLGAAIAVFLMRMFFPRENPLYGVFLGFSLVGLAYAREYWRNRKAEKEGAEKV